MMTNSIKKLVEATENIEVFYAQSYDQKGNPGVGLRSVDPVIVDDICWLIAGEVIDNQGTGIPMNVQRVNMLGLECMDVALSAQAIIYGAIVNVDLGKRKIVGRTKWSPEQRGFLSIEK